MCPIIRQTFAVSGVLAAFLVFASHTHGQSRCDCSVKMASSCQAAITFDKRSFTMTSDTPQCSQIDWVVDRQSKITVITDGKATERPVSINSHPDFWLKGCFVCADQKYPGNAKAPRDESSTLTATVFGKWCSQEQKDKASYVIAPEGVTTRLAFGRPGRKFDKFTCNSSSTQCTGEINGINNVLAGERIVVNFHYVYSLKGSDTGTLAINRINAADGKALGTTTALLTRCD